MNCALCKKPISNYQPQFNRLEIDESNAADICPECITRFRRWQQRIYADLFPTKPAKKRYKKITGY